MTFVFFITFVDVIVMNSIHLLGLFGILNFLNWKIVKLSYYHENLTLPHPQPTHRIEFHFMLGARSLMSTSQGMHF